MKNERYGYERASKKYGTEVYSDPKQESANPAWLGLPDYITSIWSEVRFSCHADGFVCFIDPREYLPIVNRFLGSKSGLIPFARNSFGKIIAYKEVLSILLTSTRERQSF